MAMASNSQRAKVYKLNGEGNWVDKGTGHVSIEYLELSEAVGLVVIDEEDNSKLLVHKISKEDIYRKTDDTIISWRDPEALTDLALSFQENSCCSFIWDQICDVRRSIHLPSAGDGLQNELFELPTVSISSLPKILKVLTDTSMSFLEREHLASLIAKDPTFLSKLCELFTTCEDIGTIESLHMLFNIVKSIIALNDSYIFEIIFNDSLIMDMIGMLEYDPDVAIRQNHRHFFKEHAIFKEVVPISNPTILAKIHQTYRLNYIKDVILPNVLDNLTFASINAMILNNNLIIMKTLVDNSIFIKKLFEGLKSSAMPEKEKADLVRFLQEFCSLSKTLQLPIRVKLFSSFVEEGLFDVVTELLVNADENIQLSGAEILIVILNNYESSALQNFLMHQPGQTLLSLLVSGMLTPGQGGVPLQLLEVTRMLLDCDATDRVPPEKSPFLEVFYATYMDQIIRVLTSSISLVKENHIGEATHYETPVSVNSEMLGNICELLSFCVQHHTFRIKYYMMRNQVMEKVLKLTKRREKHLVIAAVRFLRICVGRKDEFYYRYIVKNDLFGVVVQVFLANGGRYNLLDSTVLDLFNTILMDDAKSLLVYIIEKYYDKLKHIQYVDIFEKMKIKYDQVHNNATEVLTIKEQRPEPVSARGKVIFADGRKDGFREQCTRTDKRDLDKDENHLKKASDYENDSTALQRTVSTMKRAQAVIMDSRSLSGAFGLVDYEDEDEDAPIGPSNGNEVEVHIDKESGGVGMQPDKLIPNVKRKPIPVAETRNLDDMLEQQKNEKQIMNVEVPELLKSSNPLQEERAWKRHRNVSRR